MNVLVYMNKSSAKEEFDSTSYVADFLKSSFNVDFKFGEELPEKNYDFIFNRLDIPWNPSFLVELSGVSADSFHVNDPLSKVGLQSKEYLGLFPDVTPRGFVSGDANEISYFVNDFDRAIIKPLDMNQGEGVLLIDSKDPKGYDLINFALKKYGSLLVQEFLSEVSSVGDTRINYVDFEPVSGFTRIPKKGSYLANTHKGASVIPYELKSKDYELAEKIAPFLKENGLYWVGVDVIGDKLGEINVSSPGGLKRADVINGNSVGAESVKRMLEKYY